MQPFFNRNNRDSSPSSVRWQKGSVPFCPEFVAGRKRRSCVVTELLGHGDMGSASNALAPLSRFNARDKGRDGRPMGWNSAVGYGVKR